MSEKTIAFDSDPDSIVVVGDYEDQSTGQKGIMFTQKGGKAGVFLTNAEAMALADWLDRRFPPVTTALAPQDDPATSLIGWWPVAIFAVAAVAIGAIAVRAW